ncbi:MAG: hypothetical protein QOH03_2926, partial [Kribbellaceae bacterium]|nr:hypothetical protein [Kribbellaceae bacterium]
AHKHSPSNAPAAPTPQQSTDQLVVPAGGEAKVSVTVDRAAAGTGNFSGRILATAADADPIVTTFGWYAEKEQYYVTVNGIAHDGTPAEGPVTISRLDGEPVDLPGGATLENGSAKVRLVPGEYQASAVLMTDATDKAAQRFDLAVSPELTVTKDSTVTIDARPSRPVTVAAEGQPGLTAREQSMGYTVKNTAGVVTGASGISTSGAIRIFAATPTAKVTTGTSEFSSHARLEVPPYRAQVIGGESFTALDFYFGPSFTGVKNLPVFDAGHATADELKGAKGKLALIICGDLDTNGQLVKAAEDAGAAAALLYNPDAPGDGGVNGYWALGDNGEAKIPAMRISRAVAAHLKTKPVTVRVTGQAATPVIYDLVTPWQNQVPAKPQVLAKPAQLARVDELFGSHQAGMPISETRNAVTPGGSSYGGWMPPVFTTPARRTSYLLGNGTNWNSSLVLASGTGASMMTGSTTRTYRAGERLAGEWTRPVENSGLPATQDPAVLGVRRNGIGMSVEVSPFRHGPEEIGAADFGNSQLAVDRNGEEVASAPASGLWAVLPNDAADFKLTFDTGRESEFWKYSTAVHSVWSFRSQGGDGEVMPLVLADLDVPGADDLNQVKTGTPATLTLGLRHQAGSASTARFTAAELELSYDGTHWTTLPLTKVAEGKYKAIVTHPASQAGTAPSLRLTATDSAGSKLEQQVTKAYGLK